MEAGDTEGFCSACNMYWPAHGECWFIGSYHVLTVTMLEHWENDIGCMKSSLLGHLTAPIWCFLTWSLVSNCILEIQAEEWHLHGTNQKNRMLIPWLVPQDDHTRTSVPVSCQGMPAHSDSVWNLVSQSPGEKKGVRTESVLRNGAHELYLNFGRICPELWKMVTKVSWPISWPIPECHRCSRL